MALPDVTYPTGRPTTYISAVSKYIDGGYPRYEVRMEVYDPEAIRRLEEYVRYGEFGGAEAEKLRAEVDQLRGRVDDRDKLQAEVERLKAELEAATATILHNYCGSVAGLLSYLDVEATLPSSLRDVSVVASWSQVPREDEPAVEVPEVKTEGQFFSAEPLPEVDYSNILVDAQNIHLTAEGFAAAAKALEGSL